MTPSEKAKVYARETEAKEDFDCATRSYIAGWQGHESQLSEGGEEKFPPHIEAGIKKMGEDLNLLAELQSLKQHNLKLTECLGECIAFIDELKNHGINNWSGEAKAKSLIK